MQKEIFKSKTIIAAKWSTITEIVAKLISPITNMILARIISPEVFGVVATITMIISFTDMFTDAGFQKYLVQHKFNNDVEKYKYVNVAFITNLIISVIIWAIIIIFRENIAISVGNPGLGDVIAISCIQLPLTSFSSIQMALYRRNLDFKTLFMVRVINSLIPFIITIPLALLGFGYWSLIISSITTQINNAIILTIKSKWKPKLFYSYTILKDMISFSIWTLAEAISIWFNNWIDIFIIGSVFNQYYLGLYKTSTAMVNTLMSLFTASIAPVLFSSLSKIQHDKKSFNNTYLFTQKVVSFLVLPLGIGTFFYRELVTNVLLGDKWFEGEGIIGIWALTSSLLIIFEHFCSEVYRAKGKPKVSLIAQLINLSILIPICFISSKFGFWIFVYCRAFIRLSAIIVHFFIMNRETGITIYIILKNIKDSIIATAIMIIVIIFLKKINSGIIWSLISVVLAMISYFSVLYILPSSRKVILSIKLKLKNNSNEGY